LALHEIFEVALFVNVDFDEILQVSGNELLKFGHSEKHTKSEKNLPQKFDATE
jgi:hypothetical protein